MRVWATIATALALTAPGVARADEVVAYAGIEVLRVSTVSGDVRVRRSGSARVELEGRRRRLEIHREGNELSIQTLSRSVELAVPDGIRLRLQTKSGECRLEVRATQVDVQTFSGDIQLDGEAEVLEVGTLSGDIEVAMRARLLRVSTASGDVEVEAPIREATITAASGDVDWRGALPLRLEVNLASGDLDMRGDLPADAFYRARSASGDLRLDVTNEQGFRVEAQTHKGSIRLPGARGGRGMRKVAEQVDGGGADLRLESFSGTVEVRRRR